MAWHLLKSGGQYMNYGAANKDFQIDSESDLQTEPTEYGAIAIGSRAHLAGYVKEWEKGPSGWAEYCGDGGGGSSSLFSLVDVSISSPTDGQPLQYNGTTGKWENGNTSSIVDAVEDWLDEHVDPETGYVVDNTLSTAGAAADAKAAGDAVAALRSAISNVYPAHVVVDTALEFYPLAVPNGATVEIVSAADYSKGWGALFYASDKTTLIQFADIAATARTATITITNDNIAYFRPNTNFSGEATVTVYTGASLAENVQKNTADILVNRALIGKNTTEIKDIKVGKNNLYEGETLLIGRVYDGVYSDAITTMHCTDYLPIIAGRTYAVYGGYYNADYANYYDSNKVYKGSLPLSGLNSNYPFGDSKNFLLFAAPSDAAYTRITFFNSDLVDGTTLPSAFYFRDVTNSVWAKKKLLVIGDSISTDAYGNYKKWVTDLMDEEYLSNGLVTNDSYHATGFCATYIGDTSTTFINRLQTHTASDFDALIVFGGINDYLQSIDFDTFKTAVDTFFSYVANNYYHARIAVFSPLRTASTSPTAAGKYQTDYADYIKQVAKSYCIPVLNLTDESGFFPFIEAFKNEWTLQPAGYDEHDGVHPTETWERDYLAPMIRHFMDGLY